MDRITKAVIPAAGKGSRLKPITGYLPKPMFPLGRKPVLAHIVEELMEADIEEIGIVAPSNQTAIFKYFKKYPEVEFIIDDTQSGPGGALLSARSFAGGDGFVTIFADAPLRGDGRGKHLKELMQLKDSKEAAVAMSVYQVPAGEAEKRGVVTLQDQVKEGPARVADMKEKPSASELSGQDQHWVSSCRYVLDPTIFEALEQAERDDNNELQLTTAIAGLCNDDKPVWVLPLPEALDRYDTGNFDGYFEAFGDFAD